ncbi:MAG: ABC transporter permease [Spirochaetales bacterium]|nr:ABC transporter permease [Spirochaetales bacterium]
MKKKNIFKSPFFKYLVQRLGQFLLVVFVGITVTFIVPRLSPTNPVEQKINQMMVSGANIHPEALESFRSAMTEMYGLEGTVWDQYRAFWGRFLRGDLGPSLSSYPVPVIDLIKKALPWTIGLMLTTTLISWFIGNLLGGLAGYFPEKRWVKWAELGATCIRPIPYYITAFILLIIFCFIIPVFPTSGAYARGVIEGFNLKFIGSVLYHTFLPALSLILVGLGGWLLGMRSLVSNIVADDFVLYAEAGGIDQNTIMKKYVIRNALLPQITGLGMSLGAVFSGALITEIVFGIPGLGQLTYRAVISFDYSLIMGVSIFSIMGVSVSVLIVDLLYPLFDPRIRLG